MDIKTLKHLSKVLSKKEKSFFLFFVLLFVLSACFLVLYCWQLNTEIAPRTGGTLREGIVGQPRFINPILSPLNDPDRDLVNLIYSGLFKYNKNGKVVPDMAESYDISEDGKTYTVSLKKNIYFHDGKKLSADDVVFTIKTVQNPAYKSPIQLKWAGVEIEKISDYKIAFTLQNPYPAFLETLTLQIMPSHIWQEISAENFPWSPYNLIEPIGTGPYVLSNISQDRSSGRINSITLTRFHEYHGTNPYINQIVFFFFENTKELISAVNNGAIDSFALTPSQAIKDLPLATFRLQEYSFLMPRYFALFFNPKDNELLKNKDSRTALAHLIDRNQIIEQGLLNKGEKVYSPFLPEIFNIDEPGIVPDFNLKSAEELFSKQGFELQNGKLVKIQRAETMNFTQDLTSGSKGAQVTALQQCLAGLEGIYPEKQVTGFFGEQTKKAVIRFQEAYADEILTPAGLTGGNGRVGPGTRKKLNEICVTSPEKTESVNITITTSEDPTLVDVAQIIKNQWGKLGVQAKVETFSITELRENIIKNREYEILLFGHVLGIMPDPYPFWHSSQREYPGLNLANYQNRTVDQLLEGLRTESNWEVWAQNILEAQSLLLQDMPAIFLYNPHYTYFASERIKGIEPFLIAEPSQRFAEIENWYISTRRTLSATSF